MSTRYDTVGIVLANSNGTLSDGRPSVLAEIDGVSVLERAIGSHVAAWTIGRASPPIVVVVHAAQAELIRKEIEAVTCDSGLIRYALVPDPDPAGPKDAIASAIAQLRSLDVYPENVVITMGNAGLWRPETLRAVRNALTDDAEKQGSVMTLAVVQWNTHRTCFWDQGLVVYSGADEALPGQAKRVLECWEYGPGRNGRVGVSSGEVSARLFCFDFAWLLDCAGKYLAQYQGQGMNLPIHVFLHTLVAKAYEERRPVALFRLLDEHAHEALCVRRDDDLEYVEGVLHAPSPTADMPDATRFAAEHVAVINNALSF